MSKAKALLPLVGVAILLAVWTLVTWLKLVDPVLLPSPLATFRTLWQGMVDGKLGVDFAKTVMRTIYSTAIAAVIAIPLGILLGSSEKLYRSVEFLIDFFRSTPASAMFPLFLVLFGVGDRTKIYVKIAASGGRRRRAGFYSAIRREVPIRTFNDWNSPPPGFCEVDMVAHGGTSVAGSFIQTLTMVDVATGWTECLPLVTREGSLVVEAINRAQSLFPWLLRGVDFDNDSAFMNDAVVPWCREQKLEVTRSRAYKKNDQAFVEQKNGAVVRRLMGYGRFDGVETARVMGRLYAAARLYVNFFQPSFKLKEKRREGAKVIKRYHPPSTPYERALAHPKVTLSVKKRLRDQYRSLDPVELLAEIRATQDELGNRVDRRAGQARGLHTAHASTAPATAATFAKTLGKTATVGEPRATHRRTRRPYKTRVRMPSKLDPHIAAIEGWLAEQPQLTALAIVGRLSGGCVRRRFGDPVQRRLWRHECAKDAAARGQGDGRLTAARTIRRNAQGIAATDLRRPAQRRLAGAGHHRRG